MSGIDFSLDSLQLEGAVVFPDGKEEKNYEFYKKKIVGMINSDIKSSEGMDDDMSLINDKDVIDFKCIKIINNTFSIKIKVGRTILSLCKRDDDRVSKEIIINLDSACFKSVTNKAVFNGVLNDLVKAFDDDKYKTNIESIINKKQVKSKKK